MFLKNVYGTVQIDFIVIVLVVIVDNFVTVVGVRFFSGDIDA